MNEKITTFSVDKTITDFKLPAPINFVEENFILKKELSYQQQSIDYYQQHIHELTDEQKNVYNNIMNRINNNISGIMFLDAPGGTGKTFVLQLILATVRKNEGKIALATSSIGIAATLLIGGNTVHSAFKVPLHIENKVNPMCNIPKESHLAEVIRNCDLIVWDECTISHKFAFEAVDRTLQDIKDNSIIIGGIPILICGDFRQTLPVIHGGFLPDEVNSCLKRSTLWTSNNITKFHLKTNMRALRALINDPDAISFSHKILEIGEGKNQLEMIEEIEINSTIATTVGSVIELEEKIYSKLYIPHFNFQLQENINYLMERAILCPTNLQVFHIF